MHRPRPRRDSQSWPGVGPLEGRVEQRQAERLVEVERAPEQSYGFACSGSGGRLPASSMSNSPSRTPTDEGFPLCLGEVQLVAVGPGRVVHHVELGLPRLVWRGRGVGGDVHLDSALLSLGRGVSRSRVAIRRVHALRVPPSRCGGPARRPAQACNPGQSPMISFMISMVPPRIGWTRLSPRALNRGGEQRTGVPAGQGGLRLVSASCGVRPVRSGRRSRARGSSRRVAAPRSAAWPRRPRRTSGRGYASHRCGCRLR
jgi:hypothetical protein